jgi:hypothetical protein
MSARATHRRRWLAAWVGGAAIGIGNGVGRDLIYGKRLGEPGANRLSALTAIAAFVLYFRALQRRWPLGDGVEASQVGAAWLVLTVCFECALGRLVVKKSWSELADEYDVRKGRLWPLVLASIALGPEITRRRAAP